MSAMLMMGMMMKENGGKRRNRSSRKVYIGISSVHVVLLMRKAYRIN